MEPFHEYFIEYKQQMEKGTIQKAYQGLMTYISGLRTHLKNQYPEYFTSGGIYFGYMDMTYFSFMPASIKDRRLKVAIVFIHDSCRFEVWLGGYNKQVQKKFWDLLKERDWNQYPVVSTIEGMDSIIEHTLVEEPDFSDLDALTKQIETGVFAFIQAVEIFLSKNES